MVQVLQVLHALLRELVVLIVLRGVEDDHREDHTDYGEDKPIQLDDRLWHLFGGDLFFEVYQLLRLRVVTTSRRVILV